MIIAGQGPDRERLEALIAELAVTDTVTLAGFLPNPYALLARANPFVLLCRWEGFALALAEAVILKAPAIADGPAGPSEILASGQFGDLVTVDDVAALTRAITRDLREPERLKQAAIAGSAHVRASFDANHAAARHLDILRDLVRKPAA